MCPKEHYPGKLCSEGVRKNRSNEFGQKMLPSREGVCFWKTSHKWIFSKGWTREARIFEEVRKMEKEEAE